MDYECILTADGELYHWGIKGMKWGRRLYQNKDGSLTPLGKKRYAKEEAALKEREKVIKNREREVARRTKLDSKKAELDAREEALNGPKKKGKQASKPDTPQQKTVKDMTDDEIRSAIARKQLESQYNQLHPQPAKKDSFVKNFVDSAIKPAAINAGRDFIEKSLKKVAADVLKDKVDPNSLEALKKTYEKLDYKYKIDKLQNPDNYLSEEDKTKRQDRENKAEDRAARKEGYQDAADKAIKTREAEEAARKAKADSKARAANESKSKEYYDSVYSNVGGETTYTSRRVSSDQALTIYSPQTRAVGQSYVNNYGDWDASISTVVNRASTNDGAARADAVLDKYGNVIVLPEDY